jgi:DNA polymerase-3 subunit delta
MGYLAFSEMELDDLDQPGQRRKLETQLDCDGSHAWLDQLIAYCREKRLSPPTDQDASDDLLQAIRRGFPKGHHLIITTELVDKRKKLFKTIREDGISVDCSTPKGERRADRMAQETILREHMESALAGRGKTMDPKAFHAASNMTGFDLRSFSGNLEKLMDYVGERQRIGIEDVHAVLKRTKSDPIFEFTNALVARNLKKALFFLNSLLAQNFAALQLLAAMVNQIRKLLVARNFLDGPRGNAWSPGISFQQFKSTIMPLMQAQDQDHQEMLSSWEAMLVPSLEGEDSKRGKGKRKKAKQKKEASDLMLVKNPRSPYPVFLLLQKADDFSRDELLGMLVELSRADRMLKSSPVDPKIVLEKLLFSICSPQCGKRQGGR